MGNSNGKTSEGSSSRSPTLPCPKGHPLGTFVVPNSRISCVKCDGCSSDVRPGSTSHTCRTCDFDLCESCFEKLGKIARNKNGSRANAKELRDLLETDGRTTMEREKLGLEEILLLQLLKEASQRETSEEKAKTAIPISQKTKPNVGDRVRRRWQDWKNGNQEIGGPGTIQGLPRDGMVRVKWDKGGSGEYHMGAEGMYDVAVLVHPGVGDRVKRGPDWKWDNQDGGNGKHGTIVKTDVCTSDPIENGWARVRWDGGNTNNYRAGANDKHDLEIVVGPGSMVPISRKRPVKGDRVRRGPDWSWKDQDGCSGSLGTILQTDREGEDDGWVRVKWDQGGSNSYRMGRGGKFELTILETRRSLKEDGNAALRKHDYKEAVRLYTLAIQEDSSNYVLYSNRSAAFLHLNEGRSALNDANRCVQLNSSWAKGYSRKGAALYRLGFPEMALAAYKDGLEKDPSNEACKSGLRELNGLKKGDEQVTREGSRPSKKCSKEELKGDGTRAFNDGKFREAVLFFSKAIELDPSDHLLLSLRSKAHLKLSNFQKALDDAERCISLEPKEAKGYVRKANVLRQLDRLSDAEEAYKRGSELEPTNDTCRRGQSEMQKLKEEWKRAAMDAANNNVEHKQSIDLFTKAIKANPSDHLLLHNRSLAYLNTGEYDKALLDAKTCVDLEPRFARGYHRMGTANLELGNYVMAEKNFSDGLKWDHSDSCKDGLKRLKDMKAKMDQIPKEYLCPITHDLMQEPVVAADTHTYDRHAIENWFKTSKRSPLTNEVISQNLIPNTTVRNLISTFKSKES